MTLVQVALTCNNGQTALRYAGEMKAVMTVTMESRENGHILYVVVSDPWDVTEIERITEQTNGGIAAAAHPVHLLVNVEQARRIPPGLLTIARNPAFRLRNFGYMAIVGTTPLLRGLTTTVLRIAHYGRGLFFDTEDEALAYLRQVIASESPPTT